MRGYYRKVNTHTNVLPDSITISNWNQRGGTESVTDNDTVSPDGTQNASKITNLGAVFTADIWKISGTGVVGNNVRIEPSIWIKPISATGVLGLDDPMGTLGSAGQWNINFLYLDRGWQRITRFHRAVTVNTEFLSTSDGRTGIHLLAQSGTLDFWAWGAQVEEATRSNPFIPTTTGAATAATKRDNHWAKDHNGIWRRHLKLEGPRNGYSEWTNLIDYSAGPFNESPGGADFWDTVWSVDSYENVASCVEGGAAIKTVSTLDSASRFNYTSGTYSGNVEVISGIFERVGSEASTPLLSCYGNPTGTHYIYVGLNSWSNLTTYANAFGNAVVVDSGVEDLGIGPNGGQLVRFWFAYDSSVVGFTGEARYNQWRIVSSFTGVHTGIMHHAQLIEIPPEYSFLDNGAPTGPIVNLDATNNSINREQFSIPISFNPQALTVYVRFIQRWRDGDHTVFCIGDGTGERLKLTNSNGTTGTHFFRHHDGTAQVQDTGFGLATDFGDTIEFVGTLFSDGSVQGRICKNGGSWVVGTQSAGLTFTGSWAENLVHIGSFDDSNNGQGFMDFEAFKIVDQPISSLAGAEWLRGYGE